MPYINVDTDRVRYYSGVMNDAKIAIEDIRRRFLDAASDLEWDIKNCSDIGYRINEITRRLMAESSCLCRMNLYLNDVADRYNDLQNICNSELNNVFGISSMLPGSVNLDGGSFDFGDRDTTEMVMLVASEMGISIDEASTIVQKRLEDIVLMGQGGIDANASASASCNIDGIMMGAVGSATIGGAYGVKCPSENIRDDIVERFNYVNDVNDNVSTGLDFGTELGRMAVGGITFEQGKTGKINVSKFMRDGKLNKYIQSHNNGIGIGTRYNVDKLNNTKVLGKLYNIDTGLAKIGNGLDVIEKGLIAVEGGVRTIKAVNDISSILNDDTMSSEDKLCEASAIGITTGCTVGLKVGAPVAGNAVRTLVSFAPIPGAALVAVVAGAAVEGFIGVVADVISSDKVREQVSSSTKTVNQKISSNEKILSSVILDIISAESPADVIDNIGTCVGVGVDTAATIVGEGCKVVGEVVAGTCEAIGGGIVKAIGDVGNWFMGFNPFK